MVGWLFVGLVVGLVISFVVSFVVSLIVSLVGIGTAMGLVVGLISGLVGCWLVGCWLVRLLVKLLFKLLGKLLVELLVRLLVKLVLVWELRCDWLVGWSSMGYLQLVVVVGGGGAVHGVLLVGALQVEDALDGALHLGVDVLHLAGQVLRNTPSQFSHSLPSQFILNGNLKLG